MLAKMLAAAVRDHEARTGESVHKLAERIGIPHQRLYEMLRRADDPTYDPGRKRLEQVADAIGCAFLLVPSDDVEEMEALLEKKARKRGSP